MVTVNAHVGMNLGLQLNLLETGKTAICLVFYYFVIYFLHIVLKVLFQLKMLGMLNLFDMDLTRS